MQQYLKWILFIFTCLTVVACSNPHSPKGVAKSFWDGVLAQDEKVTKEYVSIATQDAVNFSQNAIDWKEMRVQLGTTETVDGTAIVHTTVQNKSNGAKYNFNTYLVQEQDGKWRVDYVRTRKASITSELFTNIIDSLKKLNLSLNENFDDTVAGFREAAPNIKVELDNLTETLTKHMEPSQPEHAQVHKSLETFKASVLDIFQHQAKAEAAATTPATAPNTPAK